jgi:hypothetical protein
MEGEEGYLLERVYIKDPSGMVRDRILEQFVQMLRYTNVTPKQRQEIIQLLSLISYKMLAIWTHDQRYKRMEMMRIVAAEADPQDRRSDKPIVFEHAHDMYIELDEFLVQVKSTLDYMVKMLHYTFGFGFDGQLHSFHKNGLAIVNLLKRNTKQDERTQKAAAYLIKFIEREDHQHFLKAIIDARNAMNHFQDGGLSPMEFVVVSVINKEGEQTLYRPRFGDGEGESVEIKTVMLGIQGFIWDFVEYFLGLALAPLMSDHGLRWLDHDDPHRGRWEVWPMSRFQELES